MTTGFKRNKPREIADAFIVVVDDDQSVRLALKRLLKANGFRVEAIASAKDFLDFPDLCEVSCLFLDVRMPEMDGFELQRRLAGIYDFPIIFITGHGDEDMRERALQAGAIGFLTKPFDEEALLSVLRLAAATQNLIPEN